MVCSLSIDKNQETGMRMAQYSDTKLLEADESCGRVAKPGGTKPEDRTSEATRPDTNNQDKNRPAESTVAPEQQTPHSSHPL